MRRSLLAAFVFGLASVTAWAAAIPFASSSPVTIAYSVAQGQGNASNVVDAPQQTFRYAAIQAAQDDLAPLRFDWWRFPVPTPVPADVTQPFLTPVPQVEPTALPDQTPT